MKRSVYAFILSMLAAAPAAFVVGSPSTGNALHRRMLAADICMSSGLNFSQRIGGANAYNPIGVVGNGQLSTSSTVACTVPSDSHFQHVSTRAINVHTRRNRAHSPYWNMGARACVQSYGADTYSCGNAIFADAALGEKTLALGTNQLTAWNNAAYTSWGAYVWVTFQQDDVVRFIYTST